jgi:hypothetical protein
VSAFGRTRPAASRLLMDAISQYGDLQAARLPPQLTRCGMRVSQRRDYNDVGEPKLKLPLTSFLSPRERRIQAVGFCRGS